MKPEYQKGPEARKKFEEGMSKLFRAPKPQAKRRYRPPFLRVGATSAPSLER